MKPEGATLRFGYAGTLLLFVASILMTWIGLGELKKQKHAMIPGSIILAGICFGLIFGAFSNITPWFEHFVIHGDWFILLLPIALIIPILTKSWIDASDDKNSL